MSKNIVECEHHTLTFDYGGLPNSFTFTCDCGMHDIVHLYGSWKICTECEQAADDCDCQAIQMSEVIHETEILYKKTSTGKIQQWRAWVETTDEGFLLKVESGQTDGQKTETAGRVINEGKQKRSAREQAIFEATSKVNKKRDEAYFDTIEQAQNEVKLLPMLAHPFTKRKHNITYPAIVQRKFDGVRCLAILNADGTVKLMSRKGKEFPHLNHIRKSIPNRTQWTKDL